MSETEIIQPNIEINNIDNSDNNEKINKKSKKQESTSDPPRIVHIKEFDINSIPPHEVADNSGVKIVVIGKPGTGKMICQ
jgi:hypothetical protein